MTNGREGSTDDAVVVLRMAAGSEAALETLYDRYGSAIFAAAYRLTSDRGTAEEVVQETFLILWNRAETFDPRTGSLGAWLHAIARLRAIAWSHAPSDPVPGSKVSARFHRMRNVSCTTSSAVPLSDVRR